MKPFAIAPITTIVLAFVACGSKPPPAVEEPVKEQTRARSTGPTPQVSQELGSIDQRKVEQTFAGLVAGPLETCHKQGRDRIEFLTGDVKVFLRIDGAGKMKYGFLEDSTLGDRDTEKCILGILGSASWPKPEGGEAEVRSGFGWGPGGEREPTAWPESKITAALMEAKDVRKQVDRCKAGLKADFSVTAYVEWVLGSSRAAGAPFVTTRVDADSGAMLANNPWNPAFGDQVAFADLAGRQTSWTGDRREFIGRNGGLAWPAALVNGTALSGRTGSGLDPCAALQTTVEIAPNGVTEIVFFLGDAPDETEARSLIDRYRRTDLDAVLSDVRGFWDDIVGTVQVKTPDRSMDIMLNGWLTYQTLACRVWARSGFYQASGAYGFRDQLQDCMALATVRPSMTREHLLRAASRQFGEGDVQHWWLPHSGQGVRTRISDDRAWLAYATAHYIKVTGDAAILDEVRPFLAGPALELGEGDSFFLPTVSDELGTLYEHCARALDASLAVGRHGLPLMGGGDWNDGMNRVGEGGKGESVWLGWLLYAALGDFADVAERRGDHARVAKWRAHIKALNGAFEREAWDGHWYRRGWFDDGSPLGSATSEECRIDSIAQSWAVLSGAARPARAAQAMEAVDRELILPNDRLALLFTPPFDHSALDPGYIKGYPPGLRENGGQYTHAALWSVMAFARLGEGDKAAALFGLLNPINHARTRTDMYRYKVEPYVVAADVYAAPGHVGRGGWTWYTGSAGWMQRAGVENILGLRIEGGLLHLDPCIPGSWPRFEIALRHGASRYEVVVENPKGVQRGVAVAELDGVAITARPLSVPLIDDGAGHRLVVRLG